MRSLSHLTITELRTALTPERLRTGQIIQGALLLGAMFFFGSTVLIAYQNEPVVPDEYFEELMLPLTLVTLVQYLVAVVAGHFLYNSRFSEQRLLDAYGEDLVGPGGVPIDATPAEKLLALMRTALLIRTALLEGATFMGLACLIIAAQQGVFFATHWFWVNAVPFLTLVVFVVQTFPTAERIENVFEAKVRRQPLT